MMGRTPEEAAKALGELGADVIGANCGSGVARYVSICRRLAGATDLPIWIKPNAGIPEIVAGRVVYRTTPEAFAAHLDALAEIIDSHLGGWHERALRANSAREGAGQRARAAGGC